MPFTDNPPPDCTIQESDSVLSSIERRLARLEALISGAALPPSRPEDVSISIDVMAQLADIQRWRSEVDLVIRQTCDGIKDKQNTDKEIPPGENYQGYARLREDDETLSSDEVRKVVGANFEELPVTIVDAGADVEAATQEYRSILQGASMEYDIMPDVWGATTFLIVKVLGAMAMGGGKLENLLRTGMILFCYLLNLFLQIMFLYWIAVLVMLPNIKEIQGTYKMFHSMAFSSDGNFDKHSFDSLGESRSILCGMAVSTPLFMCACILLWVTRCFDEFRTIYRRKRALDLLPWLPRGVAPSHMVRSIDVSEDVRVVKRKHMIVCLNTISRIFLVVFIFIPRGIVACGMLLLGTSFLTATNSFEGLILNSLAMAFVFDIDQLLFSVFLPMRLKKNLEQTKIKTPTEKSLMHLEGQDLDAAIVKRVYLKSFGALIGVLTFLVIWLLFQPIIPNYDNDVAKYCKEYQSAAQQVPCKWWDVNCFPK